MIAFMIAFGAASILSLGSLEIDIRRAVDFEAKRLLGGDIAMTLKHTESFDQLELLENLGGELARDQQQSTTVVAAAGGVPIRVRLHIVNGAYPLYGGLETEPAAASVSLRDEKGTAVVERTLLERLGKKIGDPVIIGGMPVRIVGTIKKAPGDLISISQIERHAFISSQTLDAAVSSPTFTSSITKLFLRFPQGYDIEKAASAIKESFGGSLAEVTTIERSRASTHRDIDNISNFTAVATAAAFMLAALGSTQALALYFQMREIDYALLCSLGVSRRVALILPGAQGLTVILAGLGLGVGVGVALQSIFASVLARYLTISISPCISWNYLLTTTLELLTVLFPLFLLLLLRFMAVLPLSAARNRAIYLYTFILRTIQFVLWFAIIGFVCCYVYSLAGKSEMAWVLAAVLIVGLGLAVAAAQGFNVLCRFVPALLAPFPLWMGLKSFARRGGTASHVIVALSVGMFTVQTVNLAQATIQKRYDWMAIAGRINIVAGNVPAGQLTSLEQLVRDNGGEVFEVTPVIPARLVSINNQAVDFPPCAVSYAMRRKREIGTVPDEQDVLSQATSPISMHENLNWLKVRMGDELTWEIDGITVRTKVASFHQGNGARYQANVLAIFPESVVADAPRTFLVGIHTKSVGEGAILQQRLNQAFPSILAIDLMFQSESIMEIFGIVSRSLDMVVAFIIGVGILCVISALISQHAGRLKEIQLLRALGASRWQIVQNQLIELSTCWFVSCAFALSVSILAIHLLACYWLKSAPCYFSLTQIIISLMVLTLSGVFSFLYALTCNQNRARAI